MNKSYVFLISALLASSIHFAISVIPSLQAQSPTPDLPMTIINETSSSNNTAEVTLETLNMSPPFSQ